MIGICKDCKKEERIEARGMCLNCYGRFKYHNFLDKEKYRKNQKIWREENKERIRIYMREYMRKRLNVKNPRK